MNRIRQRRATKKNQNNPTQTMSKCEEFRTSTQQDKMLNKFNQQIVWSGRSCMINVHVRFMNHPSNNAINSPELVYSFNKKISNEIYLRNGAWTNIGPYKYYTDTSLTQRSGHLILERICFNKLIPSTRYKSVFM